MKTNKGCFSDYEAVMKKQERCKRRLIFSKRIFFLVSNCAVFSFVVGVATFS